MQCRLNELEDKMQIERYLAYVKDKISKAKADNETKVVVMICPATVVSRKGFGKILDVLFGKKVLLKSSPSYEKAIRRLVQEGYRLERVQSSNGYSAFRVIATL